MRYLNTVIDLGDDPLVNNSDQAGAAPPSRTASSILARLVISQQDVDNAMAVSRLIEHAARATLQDHTLSVVCASVRTVQSCRDNPSGLFVSNGHLYTVSQFMYAKPSRSYASNFVSVCSS